MREESTHDPIFGSLTENQDPEINLRAMFEKLLDNWKWIGLGIVIAAGIGYYYLQKTSNVYQAATTIIIDDGDSGSGSELAAFQDLNIFSPSSNILNNEIGILRSRSLMRTVVSDLKINITYFVPDKVANSELYKDDVPFRVNFFNTDSLFYQRDTSFIIVPVDNERYKLTDIDGGNISNGSYGENLKVSYGEINITPNNIGQTPAMNNLLVKVNPFEEVVRNYVGQLEILQADQDIKSTILTIKLKDNILEKAKDVLNVLILNYNDEANNYRRLLTERTDSFINMRINEISSELNLADQGIEDFKKRNRLTNMDLESGLTLELNKEIENRIVNLSTQLRIIEYVIDYVNNNPDDLIPTNLGLKDEGTTNNANTYNQLLLERNRILKGSSRMNPTVINLDEQLLKLRESIQKSLDNAKSSIEFALNDVRSQERLLINKQIEAPEQEREIQDIKRKQQIIETLYLYLLQKREENAIKQGVVSPNAKIVDKAFGRNVPVSPTKGKTYALALFVGALIPVLIIGINSILDNKTRNRKDIEKYFISPVLGDIPKMKSKKIRIVKDHDRDSLAESFRILRTNINYMISGSGSDSDEKGKTIYVTSTIGSEGKSFISVNLASVLSSVDKKVLLIEADLRKPKLTKYLNMKKGRGLTNYLVDHKLDYSDVIESVENFEFDIIRSGDIPPNPAELLMGARFEGLVEYVKNEYDYVIIDTPPVSLVTDTLLLTKSANLVIYVVRMNYLDKRLLNIPKELHSNNRLPNMALLLNQTDYSKSGYGYGYGYGYSEAKKRWWKRSWRLDL
ncbi:polysaccharide biosynthesis tyrosine autokinase [Lutimonas saemankumensis]|uniref:GumC family protein n=1 Tax=Lutimonas saemankumensis TaxID=483016 RepID=UPI001CD7D668|nr:polysaccharide biosynthesis tyrosine autokinase [Lutimonas saemankumensis]MCA0932641.1 polysaccharide biosynthesis tyrosine autokinase [Lutimonas saemankumensis]